MNLKINQGRCIKCGVCARICPLACISFKAGEFPQTAEKAEERCMKCQHCFCICPKGALSVLGLDPDNALPMGNYPESEKLISLMKNRRSCRAYKQENVSQKVIETLLETMASVPTGTNSLGLHFSIIDDKDIMAQYKTFCNAEVLRQIKTQTLPERYHYFVKFEKYLEAGFDPIFRGAPHALFISYRRDSSCGSIDATIATTYFELLANSMGLGTTFWGLGYYLVEGIIGDLKTKLGIPEDHNIGYAILFGTPAVHFKRAAIRPATQVNKVTF